VRVTFRSSVAPGERPVVVGSVRPGVETESLPAPAALGRRFYPYTSQGLLLHIGDPTGTGARRVISVPSPICPEFEPQQYPTCVRLVPQVCAPPALN
jgi:hypothetical protein